MRTPKLKYTLTSSQISAKRNTESSKNVATIGLSPSNLAIGVHVTQSSNPARAEIEAKLLVNTTVNLDDKIILLLGSTGAGKSNFIEKLTTEKLKISSGWDRGTSEVQAYRVLDHPIYRNQIVIVDTPGFQDKTDYTPYSNATRLHALFYFDRICDITRGKDPQCQELLRYLSGEAYQRAFIVTTTWDRVNETQRLQEGAGKKFKEFQDKFEVLKFYNTTASADEALASSFRRSYNDTFEKYWLAVTTPALPTEIDTLRRELLKFDGAQAFIAAIANGDTSDSDQKPGNGKPSANPGSSRNSSNLNIKNLVSSSARFVTIDEIDEKDIIILVMGKTGTGKTSFIRALADNAPFIRRLVTDDYESAARPPTCVQFKIRGSESNLILVDTPGFDDVSIPNAHILTMIAAWMSASTNWNYILPRERESCEADEISRINGDWARVFGRTLVTSRFDTSTEEMAKQSAMTTIQTILEHSKGRFVAKLQREMVDKRKSVTQTTAGRLIISLQGRSGT
ncbi:hypothetical protein CVT24_002683 [Panaeolus cyanescens]|uniref:G domain-containing protein n=1 Tax=Panaeolus cyanescens TaxID=181874 RepID=A0A409WBB4_9AGAR|nr:hypothetical protein CVT24_002683 [Panaeolus cyanescens]